MKKAILILATILASAAWADSSITLDPGSSALVRAGENTRVTCGGSSVVGSPECTIVDRYLDKDKYGNQCYTNLCAFFYKYGKLVEGQTFSQISQAAAYCDEKLK